MRGGERVERRCDRVCKCERVKTVERGCERVCVSMSVKGCVRGSTYSPCTHAKPSTIDHTFHFNVPFYDNIKACSIKASRAEQRTRLIRNDRV